MTPYSRKTNKKWVSACLTIQKGIKFIKELRKTRKIPLIWSSCSIFLLTLTALGTESLPANPKISGISLSNSQQVVDYDADTDLFLSASQKGWSEDLDFLVMGNSSLVAVLPTLNITPQTLGAWMSESDFGGRQEITEYIVGEGDTINSIAERFNISVNTIIWANDLRSKSVKIGQSLLILPVSGVMHVAQSGDTVSKIAKKYNADSGKIMAFNYLSLDESLIEGEVLIVPDGQVQAAVPQSTPTPKKSSNSLSTNNFSGQSHAFPFGQCTWWVAQKRAIPHPSFGNANQWIKSAAARGWAVCVGSSCAPKVGAVVQLLGDPRYGHVAYVEEVRAGKIVVSEMNYIGWGKVNYRSIPIGSYQIKGYIY